EHFAHISLVARLLGRENLITRDEVLRLQELRGTYGIKAPAPICATDEGAMADQLNCQVVQAREGDGSRLVPDVIRDVDPPSLARKLVAGFGEAPADGERSAGEYRLTYRELSKLIEEAIKEVMKENQWARR